ncbi:MAG: hypothetical protein V7K55_06710 [Nostoc sp.]|uniref:hypothetical protein n=1 Tax=Nostoc sp. TaxID=1180 RepID=UPI002FFA9884
MAYRSRTLGALFGQKSISLLMLGYRNANFFLSAKDNSAKAEFTELGMNWLVQQFVERTTVGCLHIIYVYQKL